MGLESCCVVVNPSRTPRLVSRLLRLLDRHAAGQVVVTRDRDHFVQEVEGFTKTSFRNLIVWGGDGSVHEALNILVRIGCEGRNVGFLRGGSGNGIQDSYEVPFPVARQVEAFAESAEADHHIAVDLLAIDDGNQTVYGQLCGLGFDVRVLERRSSYRSCDGGPARSGLLNYVRSGLGLVAFEPLSDGRSYRLDLSQGKFALRGQRTNAEFPFEQLSMDISPVMIEMGTRPYYGGLFKVCPDVVCNDGFLGLYIFNFENKLDVFRNAFSLWNGWHPRINARFARRAKPLIERFEIRRAAVSSPEGFLWHVDGELRRCEPKPGGCAVLEVSVLPEAIRFLVPAQFWRKFHAYDEHCVVSQRY
ncbi:MAG TPA: diacylglycerol kinase family protein [Magnetospirillaceae bacterium]|nr:diacylglycerol kinase family protein [Magnetospirillaceae bacterium]